MKLSCWLKEAANGKKFLSGKMEPMQEPPSGGNLGPQDGDMPF
jgi:hypothetical protein